MNSKFIHYKGNQNDTYRANAYALKCMYVSLAVLVFCWILDLLGIFIVDLKIMNIATGGGACFCLLAFLYAFLIGIDGPSSRYVIMFALVGMATVICTELAYHTTMFMMFPLVCSAQYFDKKVSWYTAILSCAGCAIAVLLGYRIGLCDSNMILLTYTDSAFHSAALAAGDFTINTDKSLMFLFFVFPRWLIILAMMPLMNHVARDIQARTAREAMARHLAEMDGLTGIYNRNKYLQSLSSYYPGIAQVTVLFFDINNLKTVNDTRGHEYGDILIRGVADKLQELETDFCKSYRIGGDEFVMILENSNEDYAEKLRMTLENDLQGKLLEDDVRLAVAIGMASGKGKNIEVVVKEADEKMYRNKVAMKSTRTTAN